MNALDLRSSLSSYGDPRHFSAVSYGGPQPPPTKVLLDGYRDALSPHNNNAEKSLYSPKSHPRNSIPPSANDPVAMYLLTETAMGDSMNNEILTLEEVEGLKKELRVLTSRTNATKRKLALELKLRDAAMSLSRLHNHKSPRNSHGYDTQGAVDHNAADEGLALSNRKCEELAMDVWHLERKVHEAQKRLLEHTAGVLQLTHKGLKKNLKNGIPHTPESLSSNNTVDDFDDRSLYKSPDREGVNGYGTRAQVPEPVPDSLTQSTIEETEKKLEFLSGRVRDMLLEADPITEGSHIPQLSSNGKPADLSAIVDAHLNYIVDGLGLIGSQSRIAVPQKQGLDRVSEQQLVEMEAQLLSIMENPGLPRSQTLPPTPDPSNSDIAEHLTFLSVGIQGLEDRVEKLLDQKSILTTQIQQQRELNSKSDAERDAKIADLIEQLAHLRKELEHSERQGQQSREDLDRTMRELELVQRELSVAQEVHTTRDLDNSDKEARAQAEAEIARLQAIIQEVQHEKDEHHEAQDRAQSEVARLQAIIQELQHEKDEHHEARGRVESDIARLQATIQETQNEKDEHHQARVRAEGEVARLQAMASQLQDATESRESAEQQVAQLEEAIHQIRHDADMRVKEASDMRTQADAEITRLEESMDQLRAELKSRLREATEARANAEENATRLQNELSEMESDVVAMRTELTMVKAELDGAYGTRAQRAAEAAANPALYQELDDLKNRNFEMAEELATLKAGKPGSGDVHNRVETLEKELRETVDDYEAMTKASIEFEKERENFESMIDGLRDRCEQLETQINEERISWMGSHNSASSMGRDGPYETTSTMVLKNEFKKMMRDTRAENMKILRAEQEERRRLETIIRNLKKEQANLSVKSGLSQHFTP
ncbi:Up-regulated during septation-domain-containing protein [Aspergillus pseudodeflectus]|uniref:Up-regulated during septation-domain-containing protein n=1 Tax=Aspergillus pseudodeflectus TaxID=176178 RepID=A0ABR4JRS8_9EURO